MVLVNRAPNGFQRAKGPTCGDRNLVLGLKAYLI